MSEPINSGFPFPGMEDSGELDISTIFGGGTPASDINPFDAPAAQEESPAEPTEQTAAAPNSQPVPQAQTQSPAPTTEPANPIATAIDKQETKAAQTAAKSLFEKAPIFSYGSAKDEITDGAMTFEELRIAKADDFPELSEGKRVSWSVEYGKVTKTIYLLPSGDGRVYELRKTELGEFVAPKDNVVEFSHIRARFTPALPLIPAFLMRQIISFFRCYMNNAAEFEALAHILWDK